MNYPTRIIGWSIAILVTATAIGCGAVNTSIKKRNLDVQTKMSDTIFLDPVRPDQKTIFIQVRNTSDKTIDITSGIKQALTDSGYEIMNDPYKAHYLLQANVLQCGKTDLRTANGIFQAGYGGAVAGAGAAYAAGGSGRQAAGYGLLGAAIGTVADALVDDTFYSMITDIQIGERVPKGTVIKQSQSANIQQGTSTQINQNVSRINKNRQLYRTRILSTAEKVNLDFAEAEPALEQGLVHSIAGLFAE